MIRKAATKALILAAVTLVSGATTVNCSKKSDKDDIGSVGLALTLPGGAIVNTVSYQITGAPLMTPINGTIDVSAPGITQATALVSGLTPGSYVVTMTAMTTDGIQNCTGTTPFTVVAGQTAMANVILQCTPASRPVRSPSTAGWTSARTSPASRRPRCRPRWAARSR